MEYISPLPYSRSSCSSNGYVCSVPDVGYICYTGWIGVGDYSLGGDGPECIIYHRAIKIMSYFCIIIPSICNILIIIHYILLSVRKKSYYVITQEFKTIFPLFFLIMGIACCLYGVLKVSYPDGEQPLVGRDVSISLMVFSATFLV
jgi:hypothetical protein